TGKQVKVSMLVEELNVNSTAVSRSLKILEEKGYIERIVSKKDRRITYVKLTDAGAEELMKAEKKMDEFAEAVLSNLEEGSLAQLTEIMNQLYNSAVQEINKRKCIQKGEEKE
ncbi:MAG: winged helix DNA-binding protein, partial [Lachnospira sp.]|nr:winged helix DNA-binding protein [Lachnospira sp.]